MAETKTTAAKKPAAKKTTTAAAKAPAKKTTTAAKPAAKKEAPKVEVKVEAVAEVKAEAPKKPAKKAEKQLKITLVKSGAGRLEKQMRTLEALGLRKTNSSTIKPDNACTRGMIFVVKHLVKVEEI